MVKKQAIVNSILFDKLHCNTVLGQKYLIRTQQAISSNNVDVVVIIKLGWANKVQRKEVLITAGPRAPLPEFISIDLVQCKVRQAIPSLVIQPLPETSAP